MCITQLLLHIFMRALVLVSHVVFFFFNYFAENIIFVPWFIGSPPYEGVADLRLRQVSRACQTFKQNGCLFLSQVGVEAILTAVLVVVVERGAQALYTQSPLPAAGTAAYG
jgi:hypothetical protein